MSGAGEQTSPVSLLNVNWSPAGQHGEDGRFEVMIAAADGQQHALIPAWPR